MNLALDGASYQFIAFGLVAALVSNFSRSPLWRSIVLGVFTLVFLVSLAQKPIFFLPLAGFLLLGYLFLRMLDARWMRTSAWCVAAMVLLFMDLKKYTFLPSATFLAFPYFTLGLSYIFFRVLHLLIDSGDNEPGGDQLQSRHIGIGQYLLYTLNFTTFVSGPIQRYDEFCRDQFAAEPIALGPRAVGLQLERLVRGFFKVNVLGMVFNMLRADALAQLSQPVPISSKALAAFELVIVYPFFLYVNFSGYIDIVIALARLMRVRLPENFNRPFSSSSFLDFWSRWHITLSTWLKTYVYNPLLMALMRRFTSRALEPVIGVFTFFVTFFLVGLWHGRTSEFIFFGILQGGGVAINKIWQLSMAGALGRKGYKALAANPFYIALGRGLTFSWFAFTMFWFWADWATIGQIFHALGPVRWLGVWVAVWTVATLTLAVWERLRRLLLSIPFEEGPLLTSRYARVAYASALALAAAGVTLLLNQPAPDIVYKAF